MSELERRLAAAGREAEWPTTPAFHFSAAPVRGRRRALLGVAASALAAIAVAFAVPSARSAILHALHLEGVSIERVEVLPAAQERPLAAGLGPIVGEASAEAVLGRPVALPHGVAQPRFRLRDGVVSVFLADPGPVLLSELQNGAGAEILKKVVGGSTGVESVRVGGDPGVWISGESHLFVAPVASPRLAGNVLLWTVEGILYRLEAPGLTLEHALRLAAQIGESTDTH
ncbi:MAG TPA: hypothetical protein VGM80_13130 [Gaiellaceae bacterium]|jgi:hypothetical protein